MVKKTNHAHIRDQRVKIFKNPCFVFDFTSLDFLTFFFNGHFDRGGGCATQARDAKVVF